MHQLLVAIGLALCLFGQTQAQSDAPVRSSNSIIDSLAKRFDAANDDPAKLEIMLKAPQRIDEYYQKPAAILQLYHKALTIAQRIGDKQSTLKLLIEIGNLQANALVDEPKAFETYSQALTDAEEEKDYESCAKIYYSLGVISEHQNLPVEMFRYLWKSVESTKKYPLVYLDPYHALQIMFLEENSVKEAYAISKQCIAYVNQRRATVETRILAYGILLEVLNKMPGKQQEAQAYTKTIRSLLPKIDRKKLHYSLTQDIALVCYEAKQYALAIDYASQIFNQSDLNKRVEIEQELCAKIISNSYEQLKQYDKSLQYHKRYFQISTRNTRNTVSLESGRKVIRAEGERNLILKQRELERARFYRNLGFIVAAFILVLGSVVFLFYRREQQQKRELTQLNATKDKLVAILSHDLHSPIANLQNNVALTDWGGLTQTEFTQQVGLLGNQLAHIRNLLDNTLTWILSQMNGLKPAPKPVDVHELVESQILAQQITATTKQVNLTNQIPKGVRVRADENHLIVIIRNLLQNALKFTQPGGEVVISYEQDGHRQQIQVCDTGVGMSPERVATLFALSQGASERGTANERGTGLGLVLVRELAEANGGQVRVESAPGKGSTFTLTFNTPLN